MRIKSAVALGVAMLVVGVWAAGAALAANASVSIVDNKFDPASVTINVGDSVTWTNNGSNRHTATADDGSWDSGVLTHGDTFTFQFDSAGTVTYHCTIHPWMEGSIVVESVQTTTPPPTTTLPPTGISSSTGPFVFLGLIFLVAGGAVLFALRRSRA